MARIRTIKPEFWTDEKIIQLPYQTRLLFIGLWNFADDYGFLEDEPERLRLQVLPSDPINAASEVDLLIAAGLLERFTSDDGGSYLSIPHFKDHQRVDHPAKSKISREDSRKLTIPNAARRAIAKKYGCPPGKTVDVECYYCGAQGQIVWWNTSKGVPSSWVSFSHEIDHLVSENDGGSTTSDNFVLACRECNRSKGTKDIITFLGFSREDSRGFAPEGNGKERKESLTQKPRKTRTPSGDQQTFIAWWNMAFEISEGCKYVITAKDTKLVKTLLAGLGLKELVRKACRLFISEDEFYQGKKDIGMLANQINKLVPVNGKDMAILHPLGIVPPDGVMFEDWKFWEVSV